MASTLRLSQSFHHSNALQLSLLSPLSYPCKMIAMKAPPLLSSPCWQQENQNICLQDNQGGFPLTHEQRARMDRQKAMALARRKARNSLVQNTIACTQQSGFPFTPVQNSTLCLPQSKQGGPSLTPEQRARMDYQKAMALARRKVRLEQQHHEELLLNRLTPIQSTLSSQQDNHVSSPGHSKQGVISLTPVSRARMDHQKAMALARRKARLEQQRHEERLLDWHTPVQSTRSSQQDNHVSVPEQSKQGVLNRLTPVQCSLSSQQDNHASIPEQSTQGVLSLTPEQRARMDYRKSMALTRRKERLEQHHVEELLLNRLTPVQSTSSSQQDNHVSSPEQSKQGVLSLTPKERARMDHQKSIALNRRKVRLEQQHVEGLLLNRLTHTQSSLSDNHGSSPLQSAISSQQDIYSGSVLASANSVLFSQHSCSAHIQGTLSSQQDNHVSIPLQSSLCLQQDNYGGSTLASPNSALFSQQDVYSGSAFACTDIALPSQQEIYGTFSLASTNSAQSLQQEMYGSVILSSTLSAQFSKQGNHSGATFDIVHSALSSQQDNHSSAALVSLQSPLSLQQDNHGGSALISVQSPLSLQHGNHGSLALASVHGPLSSQQNNHNSSAIGSVYCARSLQYDDYVGPSHTFEQREEEALARHRGKLLHIKQEQDLDEPWLSQCATGCTNNVGKISPISPQHEGSFHVFVQSSIATPEHKDGGSSLTSAQKARIVQQKEAALARHNKRLRELQQGEQPTTTQCSCDTIISSSLEQLATSWFCNSDVKPFQYSSQGQDTYSGSSLSDEQRARWLTRRRWSFPVREWFVTLSSAAAFVGYGGSSLPPVQQYRNFT